MKTWKDCVSAAKQEVKLLQVHEVKTMMDEKEDVVLIDVREREEHEQGAIPGANLVPRGVLEMTIEEQIPDRTKQIVLHCAAGGRSAMAAQSLKNMGYQNVASMEGGFRGWAQAGYPVKKQ
jgi:rhodanese-related sulfurtransferase